MPRVKTLEGGACRQLDIKETNRGHASLPTRFSAVTEFGPFFLFIAIQPLNNSKTQECRSKFINEVEDFSKKCEKI